MQSPEEQQSTHKFYERVLPRNVFSARTTPRSENYKAQNRNEIDDAERPLAVRTPRPPADAFAFRKTVDEHVPETPQDCTEDKDENIQ